MLAPSFQEIDTMTIYDRDDQGNVIVIFDSRWANPQLLGIDPDSNLGRDLQAMYQEYQQRKDTDLGD